MKTRSAAIPITGVKTALLVGLALLAWPATSDGAAKKPEPFPVADIFFEFNSTANDLGVHVFLDAESWTEVRIKSPTNQLMFLVQPKTGLRRVGLTELFFEGEEPSLDEVSFKQFVRRVPLGKYQFLGMTTEGIALRGLDALTNDIPCPVTVLQPQENAAVAFNALVVTWQPAPGMFNPDTGICAPEDVGIVRYQVIVVAANTEQGFKRELLVEVPPDVIALPIPAAFLEAAASAAGTEFVIEVLAIEDSGNKTITERNVQVTP